jgi:lipoprotein NlpD
VLLFLLAAFHACAPVHIKTRNGVYHAVGKGETLWRICSTYQVNMMSVCMFNGINDPEKISAGQHLFIPGAKTVLPVNPTTPGGPDPTTYEEEVLPSPGVHPKPELRFRWPVTGKLTSRFGRRRGKRHDGIDIAAPRGTAVYASESGKVVYSGNGIRGYGNLIIIQHRKHFNTVYAHNNKNMVKVDDVVRKGQRIATVGNTGRSRGDHLHFEIRNKVKPVDPMKYLPNPEP